MRVSVCVLLLGPSPTTYCEVNVAYKGIGASPFIKCNIAYRRIQSRGNLKPARPALDSYGFSQIFRFIRLV